MKKKIALIFGGRSLESDISVITALQTLAALGETDYDVAPVYLTEGGFFMKGLDDISAFTPFRPEAHTRVTLADGVFCSLRKNRLKREFRPDAVLICCHGGEGENGVLQGLLDFNGVSYASSGVCGSALTMDKAASKCAFEHMLLNVVQYHTLFSRDVRRDMVGAAEECEGVLRYPMIVKPASQGSSIGIAAAHDREELTAALAAAAEFDRKIIVEEKLENFREVNCAAYSDGESIVVSETETPISAGELLTFEDKYLGGAKAGEGRVTPADVGEELNALIKSLTERIYRALELRGVVRTDFLVDTERGKVYVNEVNTVPGSLAFYLFAPLGITFPEMLTAVIEDALAGGRERAARRAFPSRVLEFYGRKGGGKTAK